MSEVLAPDHLVTVVIPARDEAHSIHETVAAVLRQQGPGRAIEVIVVDDGSSDETAHLARFAGATVLRSPGSAGNPGAARNRGAQASRGDPIVFLDADCVPSDGWLEALLAQHEAGATVVGGAIDAPAGQRLSARCDYYCGCYHVHSRRARSVVPNHPPANVSVGRAPFFGTSGYAERLPAADGHEELVWQAELRRQGHRIVFEPDAVVHHHGHPGWLHLLRRNYRWAYSAIRCKAESGAGRWPWLYSHPSALIALSPVHALVHTAYTVWCWVRAGVLEPVAVLPALLAARMAYAAGLTVGGVRWLLWPDAETRALGGR